MSFEIKDIVEENMCIGCGLCVSESQSSSMVWNESGFLVPDTTKKFSEDAIKLCPFNPEPEADVFDEDKLANLYLPNSKNRDDRIGRYESTYIGYSNQFRKTSSSGGIATFIFEQLLEQKIVDHLFVVKEVAGTYKYQWFDNIKEIKNMSKTRYIPVTLERLFREIDGKEGKVAVSGVACFVKAIRLKQYYYPQYRDKIPFIVGIICGGFKSKFFTDYLTQKSGIEGDYKNQEYRIKDKDSLASDYSFGAYDKNNNFHQLKMRNVGDMWGTGLFKANACDFCDDVTTELADISLGDAWLPEYKKDGLGNSIIITRNTIANELIEKGKLANLLTIDVVSKEKIIQSQKGSFTHRQDSIFFRKKIAGVKLKKRIKFKKKIKLSYKLVQVSRRMVRRKSLAIWKLNKNASIFNKKMKYYLFILKVATKINHKIRK
ncbi:Coenzyme F420 hydrogenase/dehydrogenase, beta subunit C-terminal domain [Polaribacter sp. IC073]|uniref:Coenzyme F420 hydrogenase/dehydrogenase, beta subunit C-terminal domain n=1 Tax=Polaribacter sp. IC073 TaxID=2508540 RepID=UPI0011BE2B3F|nr:Coenzyme F420 hydrogenase/dehydrogenase, beta subunit C-terminal domain [Polaribacter sp. IC073]TXD48925.1 coenzyme F420 hydrogenase [Polaribacter sp. IC073]